MADNIAVRLEIDEQVLAALDRAAKDALYLTADAMLSEIKDEGVMPRDTGHMQNDQTEAVRSVDGASIVTTAEQSERLYFHPEYDFNRSKNAKAGGKWFEPWLTGDHKDRPAEIYAEMFKKTGGL